MYGAYTHARNIKGGPSVEGRVWYIASRELYDASPGSHLPFIYTQMHDIYIATLSGFSSFAIGAFARESLCPINAALKRLKLPTVIPDATFVTTPLPRRRSRVLRRRYEERNINQRSMRGRHKGRRQTSQDETTTQNRPGYSSETGYGGATSYV